MIPKRDNYAIQAEHARLLFLQRDQAAIIQNIPLTADDEYLTLPFCGIPYRIRRTDGHIFRLEDDQWRSADSHGEVLTLFDYLCDARAHRRAAGEFVSMASLGNHVHTGLASSSGPLEEAIDADPDAFRRACLSLGGACIPGGDLSFRLPLLPDLPIALRFWHSDEEFPPMLDLLWDANALQFLRYETTWFAAGVLRSLLRETMDKLKTR